MPADLNQMFGAQDDATKQIAMTVAKIFSIAPQPYDREHLAAHMQTKLTDASHKGCSTSLDDVLQALFREFNHDQLKLIIDQITVDMKPEGCFFGGL